MKVKTSITLSKDLLKEMDSLLMDERNRSSLIERAIRFYIEHIKKEFRDRKDIDIINRHAEKLNREAEEVLSYQVDY
jgi:metal-responsive CopG/Arc/MetJ family transcriptional regulator